MGSYPLVGITVKPAVLALTLIIWMENPTIA
jgi:hypothetical protein